jgi:hypothetical protein
MMNYVSFLLLGVAPLPTAPAAPNSLVVPGRSLGNITLGADAASLATLGPAATGDAAMQKAWATWYGRAAQGTVRTELDVYTAPQNNDVDHHTVQVVRATSTWFHLANGLRVGTTLRAIRAAYGQLPLATTYRLAAGPCYLYDDVRRGIAFETNGSSSTSQCQALIIHQPGKAVMSTYLSMPIYLKELPKP